MADERIYAASPTSTSSTYVDEDSTISNERRQKADAYDSLAKFYSDNEHLLKAAEDTLSAKRNTKAKFGASINKIQESSEVIISGLDNLMNIHPFIAVSVIAFKLVLTLDQSRRENNEKVLVLRIIMQDTMCALFQLRNIRNAEEPASDGTSLVVRFKGRIKQIAEDVRNCGSACEVYMKKNPLVRTLKSKSFESSFAEWGTKFNEHKAAIAFHIQTHTALQISSILDKIDGVQQTLDKVTDKLDVMNLLRLVDTQKEKDLADYIEENGGSKAVIEDETKLTKLIKKSGETMHSLSGDLAAKSMEHRFTIVQKKLHQEFLEDVEMLFARNAYSFGRKLDHLATKIDQGSHMVMRALNGGSHERIEDLDFKAVWKEMGWKGSVKGRHLVLMLKDYFADKAGFISNTHTSMDLETQVTPVSPVPHVLPTSPEEKWALDYITIANLQPISEAIDDDGTGFVNISEINVFSKGCPQGWSLLMWLAYWAAGHHINVSEYRGLIYALVGSMHNLVDLVRQENRYYAEYALYLSDMNRLELALRGTRPYPHPRNGNNNLARLAKEYRDQESKRLEDSLMHFNYRLDDLSTVSLVTGNGRIEKHFWPLIYLVLRRLHDVFELACRRTINWSDFSPLVVSLVSIFRCVDERVTTLRATFRHANLDADAQLVNFAFGMYQYYISREDENVRSRYRVGNSIWDQYSGPPTEENTQVEVIQSDIDGAYEENPFHENTFSPFIGNEGGEVSDIASSPLLESLCGCWTGHFSSVLDSRSVSISGLVDLRLKISKPSTPLLPENELWNPPKDLDNNGKGFSVPTYVVNDSDEDDSDIEQAVILVELEDQGELTPGAAQFNAESLTFDQKSVSLEGDVGLQPVVTLSVPDDDDDVPEHILGVEEGNRDLMVLADRCVHCTLIEDPDVQDGEHQLQAIEPSTNDNCNQLHRSSNPSGSTAEILLISGVAESMHGLGTVEGRYMSCDGSLIFSIAWPSAIFLNARLVVNNVSGKLEGEWYNPSLCDDMEDNSSIDDYESPHSYSSSDLVDVLEKAIIDQDDENTPSGFANFSRAPATKFRHYPRHEEFSSNRSKALWIYARNTVLEEVRRRISPGRYLLDRTLETNDFIKLQYRRQVATMHMTPRDPLTSEELLRLRDYRRSFIPQGARYVKRKVIRDHLNRLPYQMGYTCDWCMVPITIQRSTCINCILPDWSNTMDLCPECVNKYPTRARDRLVHVESHTLLRRTSFLQDCEYAHYIPKAEQVAKLTKAAFRERVGRKSGPQAKRLNHLRCHYCEEVVKPPFWVCLDCNETDTYICTSCDVKEATELRQQLLSPIHLQRGVMRKATTNPEPGRLSVDVHASGHTVIRIANTAEEAPMQDTLLVLKDTVDRRLNKLENRMATMETKMDAMFDRLFLHITGNPVQPGMLSIPVATPRPNRSPVERSRSRMRRGSITESEYSFKAELLSPS